MFSLKHFHTSPENATSPSGGFTLIELVVVLALVGIMLFVAVPNFQHIFTDESRKTSQWILLQVPKFKARAISENKIYALHVDMDGGKLWFSSSSMTDEEQVQAMDQKFQLAESIRIIDVLYSDETVIGDGEAFISFYPKGYSDKAILHLEEEGGDLLSFLFEPFLNQVDMIEGYVNFEE